MRRRPSRFRLIVAALATVLVGYYLGQLYQQSRFESRGIELIDQPQTVRTAARLPLDGYWTLVLPGEPGAGCEQALQALVETYNRLADAPKLQKTLRIRLLSTRPAGEDSLWNYFSWSSVLYLESGQHGEVMRALSLPPQTDLQCTRATRLALIGPNRRLYAHVHLDKPARMAESLRELTEMLNP